MVSWLTDHPVVMVVVSGVHGWRDLVGHHGLRRGDAAHRGDPLGHVGRGDVVNFLVHFLKDYNGLLL